MTCWNASVGMSCARSRGPAWGRCCWPCSAGTGRRTAGRWPRPPARPGRGGMQHLLSREVWDTDAVTGELRAFVVEHLGAADGILIVDETGDLKKGRHTVGVQRQYSGTAGRIENAQVGVYLGYATRHGHAMVDRELYLPRSWTDDPDRCAAAGVPAGVGFATSRRWLRR